jgi:hypothetical protein
MRLGTQIHYAELVCNTMTEFGVYFEGTTGTVAAKKDAKTQVKAHKNAWKALP